MDAPIGPKFFSSLDLASGYQKVSIAETDHEEAAFIMLFGLYKYVPMPFGLCGALATFQ